MTDNPRRSDSGAHKTQRRSVGANWEPIDRYAALRGMAASTVASCLLRAFERALEKDPNINLDLLCEWIDEGTK